MVVGVFNKLLLHKNVCVRAGVFADVDLCSHSPINGLTALINGTILAFKGECCDCQIMARREGLGLICSVAVLDKLYPLPIYAVKFSDCRLLQACNSFFIWINVSILAIDCPCIYHTL